MKIGDRVFVRGYIDEIRKDTVIVRNDGGYFGTVLSEVTGELPSAQQDVPDTNVGDMISRKAAIDVVKKNTFRLTFAEEQNCEGHVAWSANAVYSDVIEGALLKLPPAQPERPKGKWIKKMRVTETEKYISYDPEWYCVCCGTKYDPHIAKIVNFCYVCGEDMRGERGEQDGRDD